MEEMNMEQVLSLVLELEAQAKNIVKQASDRRDALPSEMEKRLSDMRDKYMKAANQRLEVIREEESKRLSEEIAEVRRQHNAQIKRLSSAVESELEAWSTSIFQNVISEQMS